MIPISFDFGSGLDGDGDYIRDTDWALGARGLRLRLTVGDGNDDEGPRASVC